MKSQAFARMGDIFITVGDLFAYGKAYIHAPARSGGTYSKISAATTGEDKCVGIP